MTKAVWSRKKKALYAILFSFFYFYCLSKSETVLTSALSGMKTAAMTVIPSLFPFMILTEQTETRLSPFITNGKVLPKIFHLPSEALLPLVFGAFSGFPIGAKMTANLYKDGKITKDEAERLLFFSNNTGPVFLFAGVGHILFNDIAVGVFLYIVEIAVALLIGVLSGIGKTVKENGNDRIVEKPVSITESVSRAAQSSLAITGFITFFRVVTDLLTEYIRNPAASFFLRSLFEVTSGVTSASGFFPGFPTLSIAAAAFAVVFSGASVFLQSAYFFRGLPKISWGRVVFVKLISAVLAATISAVLFPYFSI